MNYKYYSILTIQTTDELSIWAAQTFLSEASHLLGLNSRTGPVRAPYGMEHNGKSHARLPPHGVPVSFGSSFDKNISAQPAQAIPAVITKTTPT